MGITIHIPTYVMYITISVGKKITIGLIKGNGNNILIAVQTPILDFLPHNNFKQYVEELFDPKPYTDDNVTYVTYDISRKMNKYLAEYNATMPL